MKIASKWPTARLGEVARFYAGSSLPEGEPFNSQTGGYFLTRVSDMNLPGNDICLTRSQYWSETPGSKSGTCPQGSLVIPKRGGAIGTNKKRITVRPSILDPNLMAIWPRPDSLDLRYLYHWFLTFNLASITSGSTVPQLNKQDLSPLTLPIPPLTEQRSIAEVLDRADTLRAKRREAIALLDDLAQSIFLGMFGDPASNPLKWRTCELYELASIFSDGPFGSNLKSSHYQESGIRVVRLQNIGVGEFIDKDRTYISEGHFNTLRKHNCQSGDILIGTLGDPNLRACIQPAWLEIALNKADCIQLRVDASDATAEYVCALLNYPSIEIKAQSLMLGQTRTRISMGRLRTLKVPAPPVELQREFTDRISRLNLLKDDHRSHLAELDALFASLQYRAFRGELWNNLDI